MAKMQYICGVDDKEVEESFEALKKLELEAAYREGFNAGERQAYREVVEYLEERARKTREFRDLWPSRRMKWEETHAANQILKVAEMLRSRFIEEVEG